MGVKLGPSLKLEVLRNRELRRIFMIYGGNEGSKLNSRSSTA
jgi:hypothetical protein